MKKLMFMLAAVAMTACTQAASVYWTCTYVAKSADNYVDNGLAFFVNEATLSRSDMLALQGKGATAISDALSGSYSYTGGSDGKYSVAKADAVANATLGLSDATTGNSAYLVIFDTATITDSSNFYVTEAKTFDTLSGTFSTQIKWGDQEAASSAGGAWSSASAVPEPTSGLLMLIGMAGLALRRKRA